MQNHHRFWICSAATALLMVVLVSCAQPGANRVAGPVGEIVRSPDISKRLAPDSSFDETGVGGIQAPVAPFTGSGPVKTVPVGLLVPLTGRNAELGRALQDAATVSLFDKYARLSPSQQNTRVVLLSKDTGDTPEQAAQAMKAALAEGAQFIIGPVFADATEAAAPLAQEKNISVMSFSNSRSRPVPGSYLFGFSPTEQVTRVVEYALKNGRARIAVLAPQSPLGETVLKAARDTMKANGLALAGSAMYAPQGSGMDAAVNTVLPSRGSANFDAILIPEGGAPLDTILRSLAARGVTPANTQFLGTGIWDDAALLRRVNLDRAWFASSAPTATAQFEARFRSTYGYAPPRIASLAYDAVALAVTLASSGRAFDAAALTSNAGFIGPANGTFRLRNTGDVQRSLAVMQVEGGTMRVISPAPAGFGN